MSVASVITRAAARDGALVTFTRPTAPTYSGGKPTPGTPTTFDARVVIQPPSGNDLQRLPEGRLAAEVRAVWATVELRVKDRFSHGGVGWEIETTFDRSLDGEFYKALARKVQA